MARSVSFCALFILVLGSIMVVAGTRPLSAVAQGTAAIPHAANPSPVVPGHGAFAQPTMVQLRSTETGKLAIDPVHAFPVMLIAAMLMTCAAASIIARDRVID